MPALESLAYSVKCFAATLGTLSLPERAAPQLQQAWAHSGHLLLAALEKTSSGDDTTALRTR